MEADFILVYQIPETLWNNKNYFRNRNFSKGYSKFAILAKMQTGHPLQKSRFWPFFWPNFVRLENRQYYSDFSLISMDGCGMYSFFIDTKGYMKQQELAAK